MVFDKIRSIIAEKLEIDETQITLTSTFDDLNADSLYLVEIMMAIEEEFDISIEETDDINNVEDLVAYVASKLN